MNKQRTAKGRGNAAASSTAPTPAVIRLNKGWHWCAACPMPVHEDQIECPACCCPNPHNHDVMRFFGPDELEELTYILRDLHKMSQGKAL